MPFRKLLETYRMGKPKRSLDRSLAWDEKYSKTAKKILTYKGYDLYLDGDIYFLIKDEYVAHVVTEKLDKYITILLSNSNERGAYKILLEAILKSGYEYIFSDEGLSDYAEKFWDKMIKDPKVDTYSYLNGKIEKTNKSIDYFSDNDYRVGFKI